MIPPNKANHASFIEALPSGELIIAWFSGTKEGQNDVSIYVARLPVGSDQWTNASLVSRRDGYSNQNPVIYFDPSTKIINLWHSQQPADKGESDANVWYLKSTDGQGMNWTKPVDLLTTPGSFDRNRVIPSLDGGLIFPVYYSGMPANVLYKIIKFCYKYSSNSMPGYSHCIRSAICACWQHTGLLGY